MIDIEQELASVVATHADRVVAPALVRRRAQRRRLRRRGGIAAVLVVFAVPATIFLTRRVDSGQPVQVTEIGPGLRQAGDEIRIALETVPDGVTGFHVGAHRFFVVRDADTVRAFVDDAQHISSEYLWWCPVEEHFAAPTHGETFDRDGRKIAGPAQRDLDRYSTTIEGDELVVDTSHVVDGAPSVVSAMPPGEDPKYSRPWNSGPAAYCNGARTVDGPAMSATTVAVTGGPEQVLIAGDRGVSVINADSGNEIALLEDLLALPGLPQERTATHPFLAPDGSVWFQVGSSSGTPPTIWRLDPPEFRAAELVATGMTPAVSPDSRYLAYLGLRAGQDQAIQNTIVVRDLVDGTERRWTGLPSEDTEFWPPRIDRLSWHPDDDRIAFSYAFGFEYEERETRILDLAADDSLADALALPGWLMSPQWTPDGALMAIDYAASLEERPPIVRFDDVNAEPTREDLFPEGGVYDIDLDPSGQHVLARLGGDLYVVAPGREPRLIATSVGSASW